MAKLTGTLEQVDGYLTGKLSSKVVLNAKLSKRTQSMKCTLSTNKARLAYYEVSNESGITAYIGG